MYWQWVGDRLSCKDNADKVNKVKDTKGCADQCYGKYSAFVMGTNDLYKEASDKRCTGAGCDCWCVKAQPDGSCKTYYTHNGFRLYKFGAYGKFGTGSFIEGFSVPGISKTKLPGVQYL